MSISVNEKCTLNYEQDFTIAETLQAPLPLLPLNHPKSPGDPTCRKYALEASKSHSQLLPKTKRLTAARQGCLETVAETLKKRQETMGTAVGQNTSEHISTTCHLVFTHGAANHP